MQVVQVLNIGSNQLKGSIGLASLTSLGALILPDNQLTGITGLSSESDDAPPPSDYCVASLVWPSQCLSGYCLPDVIGVT